MLGFVGAGNMAEAICRGVIANEVSPPDEIVCHDVSPERIEIFEALGARAVESNRAVAEAADTIVLAVKPQAVGEVLPEFGELVRPPKLLVSILAGVPTSRLEGMCGDEAPVVRVMPNTPLLVGKGVSVLSSGRWAGEGGLQRATAIFRPVGDTIALEESAMDAVTAVSGSGPAYFFFLVEAMIEAGVAEGLAPEVAARLARGTAEGAGALLAAAEQTAEELRRRVTSPKGTTEAAVSVMESAGVREAIVSAVRRAAERSKELGRGE